MNELERCKMFLTRNGWAKDHSYESDEKIKFISYFKTGAINVDLSVEKIVLIGDTGYFAHLPMNYFALVGALIEYRQIGFNYLTAR